LLAPTVDGNLLAGPTSTNTRDFSATATTQQGLEHIRRVAKKLVPSLNFGNVIRNFAGARTNIVNVSKELKDFVVRVSAPGFVSALGIKNPGMTSSPYLAKMAVDLLIAEGMPADPNTSFNPHRKKQTLFLQMSAVEQAAALKADPTYANVICRCEGVTEGDIRAAMHADLAPTTMAGVKRRLRVSMGRCQGAFCEPRLVDIMADELGVAATKIPYGEHGGKFVQREVK
jgi:glycerol-3-phosphate dehydrogenase